MKLTKTHWSTRSLIVAGLSSLALTSAHAQVRYSNIFASAGDITRLTLTRGADHASLFTGPIAGRTSQSLRCLHTDASGWESILGSSVINAKTVNASVRYSVFFPANGDWQFRLQGKLPGLQPDVPHFGGNAPDAPEWNKWSVRLMWLSNTGSIDSGNDANARPSIYVYDQNRVQGDTGTHYKLGDAFQKGIWYDIDMYVELNTYDGRTARSDGYIILRINGMQVNRVNNLKLRGNIPANVSIADGISQTSISKLVFHNYYGGAKDVRNTPQTIATSRCYFDSIQVVQENR